MQAKGMARVDQTHNPSHTMDLSRQRDAGRHATHLTLLPSYPLPSPLLPALPATPHPSPALGPSPSTHSTTIPFTHLTFPVPLALLRHACSVPVSSALPSPRISTLPRSTACLLEILRASSLTLHVSLPSSTLPPLSTLPPPSICSPLLHSIIDHLCAPFPLPRPSPFSLSPPHLPISSAPYN